MYNRYFKKTLIIGIILLLSAISVGGSYVKPEDNKVKFVIQEPINYLGEIYIIHTFPSPFLLKPRMLFKPVSENERHYYFPEINGSIMMNFTMNFSHKLQQHWFNYRTSYWDFFVGIPIEADYVQGHLSKPCTNTTKETIPYWVEADLPLQTNGQNKTLVVAPFGAVGIFNIKLLIWCYPGKPYLPRWIYPPLPEPLWKIYVHPI